MALASVSMASGDKDALGLAGFGRQVFEALGREQRDVLPPLAEGRQVDVDSADLFQQVSRIAPVGRQLLGAAIARGQHPDVL